MSEHNFNRKSLSGGTWPGPNHGNPSLLSLIRGVLPGKNFTTCMNDGNVKFIFDEDLSEGDVILLTAAYDAWMPDTGLKKIYAESDLKYAKETFSGNRLLRAEYYADEILGFSGFSGFSGLGKIEEYAYSGNRLFGFSSVRLDSEGAAVDIQATLMSTNASCNIYRKTGQ